MVSFRILFVSVVLALVVLSSALGVAAAEKAVKVRHVYLESGSETVVFASVEAAKSFKGSKVAVFVPELGIREGLTVDLSKSRGRFVQVGIPSPEMFDPYITVRVTTADGRRAVKHIPFGD